MKDFASTGQAMMEQWWDPKLAAHVMEGLHKAGMGAPDVPASGSSLVEAFLVAVLPFAQPTANANLAALGDGLTEEIIAGLSRFTYLRVIGPGASAKADSNATDARTIGTKLGARYIVDGSLRQAGPTLRVSVQLLDTASGTTLWTQTFDRAFQSENIFELQDELASRIVSSVADAHGVLPRTLSESLRGKTPEELTPYEAVLRSFGYGYRMNEDEHITVRA